MKNLDLRFTFIQDGRIALLLIAAAMVFTGLLYWRAFRGRFAWMPLFLALLRTLACAACLLIILRPVISFERVVRRDSRVALLIDRSLSMGIADSVGGETRLASALRVARGESLARLGEIYHLEAYTFPGSEPLTPRAVPDIAADGARTDLAAAWQSLRSSSERLDAIVLISDGRDNRPERLRGGALLPPAPLFAVGLGSGVEGIAPAGGALSAARLPDLAITGIETEEKVLLGNRVEVRVAVRSRGFPPVATELSVLLEGKEVLKKEIRLDPGTGEVRFPLTPDRPGALTYEVRLADRPGEIFRENNVRHFTLDVAERLLQVLLYEGRVRWEYRFVRETLARDPDINPTGLVKTRGDRLLQQGTAPADLTGGLPRSREDWRKFDVLILGDLRSEDIHPQALEHLRAWVAEDGGGLIYLGGPESYGPMAGSSILEMLPVEPRSGMKLTGALRVSPALAALDHPILRGVTGFFLPESPGGPFTVQEAFATGGLRPGADPLLLVRAAGTAPDPAGGGVQVLLAAQQYGRGRSIAYLTDSDWRWIMLRGTEGGRTLHSRLWGQMVRWAARREDAASEGALSLRLARRVAMAGETLRVEARGSKERLAVLAVEAVCPGGEILPVTGSVADQVWSGEFTPEKEGLYGIRAAAGPGGAAPPEASAAAAKSAKDPARASIPLLVEPNRTEMDEPLPDWDLLRDLAARTGGRFLTLAEVGGLADGIIKESAGIVTHVELGVEDSWELYLAIIVLFTLEWTLRRRIFVV